MRAAIRTLVAGALLAASACGEPASSTGRRAGPPPMAVEIGSVERAAMRDVVALVGQLEAEESVVLTSEVSGVIESVAFSDGQRVRAGELLFQLRDAPERARLAEAEAELRLAEDEFRRTKALADKKTVSVAELDRATATLAAAQARRDLARAELDRLRIVAPFDGVLGARMVSPGDRVGDSTPLVRIDAIDRLRLAFTVPEIAIEAMQVGRPVSIAVAPFPGERFDGEVYFVAAAVDPNTRRLLLKAWVPNAEHRLRPGLFANIDLVIAEHPDATVVPEAAVAYDADGPFVWRVTPADTVERIPVTLGLRQEGRVEITAGLEPGTRIVTAGTHKVSPGAVVQAAAPVDAPTDTTHATAGGGAGQ